MIYSLTGSIEESMPGQVVIQCGGVGYLLHVPLTTQGSLPPVGGQGTLYTYLNVSENDVSLFGFATREEREMFILLTSVSGVGPKVGLAILSALPPNRIVLAVSTGDHKAFTVANGVGPKLAQRLVLELKDKIKAPAVAAGFAMPETAQVGPGADVVAQAVAALSTLGYTQSEAMLAVSKIDPGLPVAEVIRLALQGMAGGR